MARDHKSTPAQMMNPRNMESAVDVPEERGGVRPSVLMIAYTHYENDPRVIRAAEAALEGNFFVDVIALGRPGQLPVETVRGVRVFRIQERYRGPSRLKYIFNYILFFLRCTFASTRLFFARRYRVIHVHNMPDVLVFTTLIPKLLGARIILDIHDPMPETYDSKFNNLTHSMVGRLLLLQERLSVTFADATITVSEPFKNGLLIKHGYRPEAIGVIANFADDELFHPMEYSPTEETVRFVFHGTILERYGLRTLIDAVSRARHRDKIQVRIIGEGDFSRTLADLIRTYRVGDVVEFVNHIYPLHEIPKLLSDCHVGLVPLDIGTSPVANFALPLKLVEYTCLGMPSITVKNAAIEHYFHPDECMFFDSGDAQALARLLDNVVEKPGCLIEYGKRLGEVRKRLSWSSEKEKYVTLLRELAAHSLAPRG